jgi:histidinol-phosphate aminotransferase
VASGFGADLVCEADLGIYDYMALVPVLVGAGAVITDWDGKELVLQKQPGFLGRTLAAANSTLHAEALATLGANGSDKSASVLKPHLRKLTPYLPPLDGRSAKTHLLFDFNERTVGVDEAITRACKDFIDGEELRRYPAYGDLNEQIAAYAGVPPEQCMFTNGSDQGIDLIIRCCCPQGTEAIIPSPTFAMYEQSAKTEGLVIKSPNFTIDGGFPLDEVLSMIGPQTSIVICCNPNNPTGTEIPRQSILKIAEKAPHCAVLCDECYYEFMPPETSLKGDVARFPNLFVTRTFSKTWGIPSLRIGYLMSAEENIRALCCVRGPYDLNQLSCVAVKAALANQKYVWDFVKEHNEKSRPSFLAFLEERGIKYWPTKANYAFCYFQNPAELEKQLVSHKILTRPKKDADGVLGLRISFGTMEQTERLIALLKKLLPEHKNGSEPASKKLKH